MGKQLALYNHSVLVYKCRRLDTQTLGSMAVVIKVHGTIGPSFRRRCTAAFSAPICFLISLKEAEMKIDCLSGARPAVVIFLFGL